MSPRSFIRPSHYRSISLVQVRPRSRSSVPLSNQAREAQIDVKRPSPTVPSPIASTVPPHDHFANHVSSGHVTRHRAEIPIARAAAPPPTSRGFFL